MDIHELYRLFLLTQKVSTDTRQISPGSLFFALRGPSFDANTFAAEAIDKGASIAVIDDEKFRKDDRFIVVENTLAALQRLARFHRDKLHIPVVGLTGSNGKTTTKEMMAVVLGKKYKVLATKGNLNNHIGVPLTLLSIDTSVEMAIVEMGANHVGEIAQLCDLAKPTHGLITNIGRAHIGTFGGAENILRAKSELYQYLLATSGKVFINSTNPVLANMARRFAAPIFYPAAGDFYHCDLVDADPFVRIRTEDGQQLTTHLTGDYNFENIAAALCVGKYFSVGQEDAVNAIAHYEPGNMRSQIISRGSNRIILDAYNANPSSMEVAIKNLASLRSDRKIAILGDMYELGDETESEHKRLGSVLQEAGIREAYLCGTLIKDALQTCPSASYFLSPAELMSFLNANPIHDATILVKASRGMKLEQVIDALNG